MQQRKAAVLNFMDFISADGEELTTDSMKVSAVHGKRHDDILRLIRKRVAEAGEWGVRNFAETLHTSAQNGQTYPMFVMTKDGYQFLVGRMTGKKAVEHQLAFIEAFNAMAAYIKNQREGLSYRRARHDLECKDSERRGTFHGRGLKQRHFEKVLLKQEGEALKALSQPGLFLN
jgi:Rha family phage regulatory protein